MKQGMQPEPTRMSESWWYTHPASERRPLEEPPARFGLGTTEQPAIEDPEKTAKVERFDIEDPDPDRLDLADDAHLTMQLKAVKRGRGWIVLAIATSLATLVAGIALVL